MFNCKICLEKDKRIAEITAQATITRQLLQDEVANLRRMAIIPLSPGELPSIQVETDGVSPEPDQEATVATAEDLLMGNY